MFNYQKFRKDDIESLSIKKEQENRKKHEEEKAKRQPKMILNHQKRIQHSILRLISQPVKVNIYKDVTYHPREDDKQKRIAQGMNFNYQMQSSRIKHTLNKNASLDSVPFKNASFYEFRKYSKNQHATTNTLKGTVASENKQKVIKTRKNIKRKSLNYQERPPVVTQQGKTIELYSKQIKNPKIYLRTLESVVSQVDSLHIFVNQNKKTSKKLTKNASQVEETDPFEFIKQIIGEEKNKSKKQFAKVQKCRQAMQKCGLLLKPNPHTSLHQSYLSRLR